MVTINLIPESTRAARARRVWFKRWTLAVSVAALALCGSAGLDWWSRSEAARLRIDSESLRTQLAQERMSLSEVTAELRRVNEQADRAEALRAKRAWSSVLALIAQAMPPGGWIQHVATDPPRPTGAPRPTRWRDASGASPTVPSHDNDAVTIDAPRKLRVSAYAPDAADPHRFVTNLKQTFVFRRVALARTQLEPVFDGSYFSFEIVCEW